MKLSILAFIITAFSFNLKAQQYFSHPGLDKFAGRWQYFNGQDSIWLKSVVKYIGIEDIHVKAAFFYFTYKQGNSLVLSNFENSTNTNLCNLSGSYARGLNLDSLEVGGRDKLKRKTDEGYMIINTAGDQLSFIRVIGISGGGLSHSAPGEGPLPGYTLPANIVFTKMVYTEAKGVSSQ